MPLGLSSVRSHLHRCELALVAVDRHRSVGFLVGVDPDQDH